MSKHPAHTLTLVADIGGTNTRVALASGTKLLLKTVRKYSNHDMPDLETVLRRYLSDEGGVDCAGACIAVAGPVRDGVATMTNLDWTVDRNALVHATSARNVAILNDLQAQAHALGDLDGAALRQVKSGAMPGAGTAKLVIGIGTGFNAATLLGTNGGALVPPSESGHVSLPIRDAADLRLASFIQAEHGFPAIEDVLSGPGLERIYHWLGHEADDARTKSAADIMASVSDSSDPQAEKAAAVFARILGTVAGNLALIHLPFGGIYLVGGVARSIAPHLDRLGFGAAFRDKGRFSNVMDEFSISVIEDDCAALIGCASYLAGQN